MKLDIGSAEMKRHEDGSYVGQVRFRVEGHPQAYEITLFSEAGDAWDYGLHFAEESGSEAHIDAVEAFLEEDDDAFEALVEAALAAQAK